MHDPDIATWGEDGDRLDRDAEIDSECKGRDPDHTYEHEPGCDDDGWDHRGPCVIETDCPEWGEDGHRFEEQETWDHRIMIGCNCGATPSIDDLRERFNP